MAILSTITGSSTADDEHARISTDKNSIEMGQASLDKTCLAQVDQLLKVMGGSLLLQSQKSTNTSSTTSNVVCSKQDILFQNDNVANGIDEQRVMPQHIFSGNSKIIPSLTLADNKLTTSDFDITTTTTTTTTTTIADSTTTTNDIDNKSICNNKRVRFGNLHVRKYPIIMGDNPACSFGPPLSIGWEYDKTPLVISVNDYEQRRPARRHDLELILSFHVRWTICKRHCHYSEGDILKVCDEMQIIKKQRSQSIKYHQWYNKQMKRRLSKRWKNVQENCWKLSSCFHKNPGNKETKKSSNDSTTTTRSCIGEI